MVPTTVEKVVLGLCVVLLAFAGVRFYGDREFEAGRQFERDKQTLANIKVDKGERRKEVVSNNEKDKAYDQYLEQRDAAVRDADAARGELGRLRNVLADYKRRASESGTTQCPTHDVAPVIEVIDQCASRYQEVAGNAQLDAEQVIGLQNYIKAIEPVCIRKE